MNIKDFIEKVEGEFEEVSSGSFTPTTLFKEEEEWSSMHALLIIALIDIEYDVIVTGEDLKKSHTLADLFQTVQNKKQTT